MPRRRDSRYLVQTSDRRVTRDHILHSRPLPFPALTLTLPIELFNANLAEVWPFYSS